MLFRRQFRIDVEGMYLGQHTFKAKRVHTITHEFQYVPKTLKHQTNLPFSQLKLRVTHIHQLPTLGSHSILCAFIFFISSSTSAE